MPGKKVVIVGGVAGGASCAARLRRLDESAQIVLVERGPHVSFANCGLPYFIGGEIPDRDKLLVQTVEGLSRRFQLDVRVRTEAVRIDRQARVVELRDLASGQMVAEPFDALVLATGAAPLRPPIPGIDRPGHFVVRNVPDVEAIDGWIRQHAARRAVVVGGGYIGLEMAEQLRHRGLDVDLAEFLPQVMAPLDPEMANLLHAELRSHGVGLHLSDAVHHFEAPASGEVAAASTVVLNSGLRLPADLVILGLGVRPEVGLARDAGLEVGNRGGIRVNPRLQTSDPAIYAVGDCIEVRDAVTGAWTVIPLAGPANRQGRIAADNLCGLTSRYEGTYGTAVLRLFGLTAACTGANEKTLQKMVVPYAALHLHPGSHAGYYPGAKPIALKILFSPESGKLLGAQAVGADGVDKRIDVLATALKAGLTVDALAELELAYAPPYGSAKDPINMAGMAAQNVRAGLMRVKQWYEVPGLDAAHSVLLDVRSAKEREAGAIPGSLHIPLDELRSRLDEVPRDREVVVYCHSGQRSYNAARILAQHGRTAWNLTGAYKTWKTAQPLA